MVFPKPLILEKYTEEYQREIKRLELELLDLQSEMNRLKHTRKNFGRDEKMMKQMLKTNEVRIRSIEKENLTLKKKLARESEASNKLEKALRAVVGETVIRGAKKHEVRELVASVSQFVDLEELFEDQNSLDTEEELRVSLNESLKQLQDKLDAQRAQRSKRRASQVSASQDSLSLENSPTVVNAKAYKRRLSPIEKEKKNSKFKLKLEEEIEENIKARSRRLRETRGTMTVKKRSSGSGNLASDVKKQRNCKSDLEASSELGGRSLVEEKDQLFLKCKILNPEIFETYEKNKIEMRVRTMKSAGDFALWLWEYFEEKCERLSAKAKALTTEKRKLTRGTRNTIGEQARGKPEHRAQVPLDQQRASEAFQRKRATQRTRAPAEAAPGAPNPAPREAALQAKAAPERDRVQRRNPRKAAPNRNFLAWNHAALAGPRSTH